MGCRHSKEDDDAIPPREGIVLRALRAWRACFGPSCLSTQKMLHVLQPRNHTVPRYRRTFRCFNREIQFILWLPRPGVPEGSLSEPTVLDQEQPSQDQDQLAPERDPSATSLSASETNKHPQANSIAPASEVGVVEAEAISSSENTELDCSINTVVEVCPEPPHLRTPPDGEATVDEDDASERHLSSSPRPPTDVANAVTPSSSASRLCSDDGSVVVVEEADPAQKRPVTATLETAI